MYKFNFVIALTGKESVITDTGRTVFATSGDSLAKTIMSLWAASWTICFRGQYVPTPKEYFSSRRRVKGSSVNIFKERAVDSAPAGSPGVWSPRGLVVPSYGARWLLHRMLWFGARSTILASDWPSHKHLFFLAPSPHLEGKKLPKWSCLQKHAHTKHADWVVWQFTIS